MIKKDEYPHVRLFRSDFMEQFSYVHPRMPALVYIPIIAVILFFDHASLLETLGTFCLGVFIWTLLEYFRCMGYWC